jgi:UDP-GlcNAc:undecaprenyl-phosphate GlcNAc-1-phosphate transferase
MELFVQKHYYAIVYITFFISSAVFSFLINSLFLRFFKTLGIRNRNDGTVIRWGTLSKPAVGGISFYIMFLLAVASYSFFFSPSQAFYNSKFVGLLLAMALGFIIGLADDAYDTRPFLKFFIQLTCGVILVVSGVRIELFGLQILNYLFTVFWVVGIMNSINMLDNMDGITGVVSIGVVLNAILIIVLNSDFESMHLIILVGVFSSLLAFLFFNWNPSKMYMGDTGSQFLGVFLAAIGVMYFWTDNYVTSEFSPARQFALAIMGFILPILDTTVVVINRLSKGKSPFIGGKDHTTHSLAYMGLSDKQVAIVFLTLSFISVFQVIFIERLILVWSHWYTLLFGVYFFTLLFFFFYSTRKSNSSAQPVKTK